jgi:hypothetical protein
METDTQASLASFVTSFVSIFSGLRASGKEYIRDTYEQFNIDANKGLFSQIYTNIPTNVVNKLAVTIFFVILFRLQMKRYSFTNVLMSFSDTCVLTLFYVLCILSVI